MDAENKSGKSGALARAYLSLDSLSAAVTTRGDLRRADDERACSGRSHRTHTAVRGVPVEAAVSDTHLSPKAGMKIREGNANSRVEMS